MKDDCAKTPYDEGPVKISIRFRSKILLKNILDSGYFIHILDKVLRENNATYFSIEQSTLPDIKLIHIWNEFWCGLPDDSSIRRAPFFELCDLCEEMFDE